MSQLPSGPERRRLGLDARISRRDFVNGVLAGTAATALSASSDNLAGTLADVADTFTGYGGVGDYARANGNTWPVVQAAHRLRDGQYDSAAFANAQATGDFDLVVVGGGIAGLSAAYYFIKATGIGRRVLVLENHAMLGGEARQNEFMVDGERLLGPQGSNDFIVPQAGGDSLPDSFFAEFALPREYAWQSWDPKLRPLRFARDNYSNMDGFQESQVDIGYFFGAAGWHRNIWANALAETPFSAAARHDLLKWRANHGPVSEAENRHLDTITYKDYLEKVCAYDPAVTRMVEPIVGLLSGVSTDAACARLGRQLVEAPDRPMALSFPGGNSPFPRALLRGLLPESLPGKDFSSLMYAPVSFAALDRDGQPVRVRLNATALRVEHGSGKHGSNTLAITYERGGSLFSVVARAVVMASGGWINKHTLVDMPRDLRAAYEQFSYAPALIVNVALRQWRFLYDMGITACRWFDVDDGIGYCCNIRQNMVTAGHSPVLHPDRPAVLSFYMGLPIPGLPAAEQGATSRARFLATPYMDFELRIRRQMLALFARHGFKPERDIVAIVLNRWGHARLIEPPGFHYGVEGRPSPLERVRQGYGRVAIGHSELNGAQHWGSALEYGKRAGEKAAAMF
ncbi:MAG TPA: FAD-dependent oxidoreductase [Steroidobacteraceae bacterium]|nr:FAD-dependent oxidoreductase [Steroidobacteraceae bacterium]